MARSVKVRRIAVGVLVVLTTVAMFASILAVWAYRQVLNTDVFADRVESVLADPDVQEGLAGYITDQIVEGIDPAALAAQHLPAIAQPLVPALVTALRNLVLDTTKDVLGSEAVQNVLNEAIKRAHKAAIALLEGETVRGFELQGDQVVLNVLPIVNQVLQRIGERGIFGRQIDFPPLEENGEPSQQVQQLAQRLGRDLPPDFGQITVLTADKLEEAQRALEVLRKGIVLLLIVTLVLLVATILLSVNRWRTVGQLGIGLAIAMIVVVVVARWVDRRVREVVANPKALPTAEAITSKFTSSLESVAIGLLVVGLVAAAIAFIFGGSDSAARLRASATRTAAKAGDLSSGPLTTFLVAHTDGARIGAVGIGAVVLLLLGMSLTGAIVALIVTAVLLLVIELLVRRAGQARPV